MRPAWGILLGLVIAGAPLQAAPFDKGGLLGAGARESGQAGAVVARDEDPTALWWNPAGLGLRRDFALSVDYGDLLGAYRFDSAFSHRGWLDAAGLGYALGYRREGATVDVSEEDYAFALAFPFSQDGRLLLGLGLRALQAKVGAVQASGYGIDLGLHYRAGGRLQGLSAGVAVRDGQAALEWPAGPRSDPAQLFQLGLAWAFDDATSAEFDSEFVSDPSASGRGSQGFKLGAERWWDLGRWGLKRAVALRLGYLQNSALAPAAVGGQFSLGLGLQARGLALDYAFTQDSGIFGPSHRLALSYAFMPDGGEARPAPTAVPTPSPTPAPARTPAAAGPLRLRLNADPELYDPAKGGKLSLDVSAENGAAAASSLVEIRLQGGAAVAQRRIDGLPRSFAWDGRRPEGGKAPAGAYQARISVFDAAGTTLGSADASFRLLAGAGALRLTAEDDVFAPIAQSVRQKARLTVGYDGGDARRWTLSVRRVGQARPLRVLVGKGLPAALQWDGRDSRGRRVADGAYELGLALLTGSGTTVSAKAQVDVDTRRPKVQADVSPKVFRSDDGSGSVRFAMALSGEAGIPAKWSLRIGSLQGRSIKVFDGVGAPPEGLTWNGLDDGGKPVAAGTLYYGDLKVEMESGAVATLPRLALASLPLEPKLPFRVPLQTLRFNAGEEVIALEDFAGLKEAPAAVKKYSNDYAVQVIGHAAPGESGAAGLGELELSFLRAKAVRDYLVDSEGLDGARVRAVGEGSERPLGASDKDRDRRVEVILYAQ